MIAIEITAADEDTTKPAVDGIGRLWASNGLSKLWRVPGETGVRALTHADIRLTPRESHWGDRTP